MKQVVGMGLVGLLLATGVAGHAGMLHRVYDSKASQRDLRCLFLLDDEGDNGEPKPEIDIRDLEDPELQIQEIPLEEQKKDEGMPPSYIEIDWPNQKRKKEPSLPN